MRMLIGVVTRIVLRAPGGPHPGLAQSEAPAAAAGRTEPRMGIHHARASGAGQTSFAPGEAFPDPILSATGPTQNPSSRA